MYLTLSSPQIKGNAETKKNEIQFSGKSRENHTFLVTEIIS